MKEKLLAAWKTTRAVLWALWSIVWNYLPLWVIYACIIVACFLLWFVEPLLVVAAWILIVLGVLAVSYLTWLAYNLNQGNPELFDPAPETLEELRTDIPHSK